jgi:hypothetical protein
MPGERSSLRGILPPSPPAEKASARETALNEADTDKIGAQKFE